MRHRVLAFILMPRAKVRLRGKRKGEHGLLASHWIGRLPTWSYDIDSDCLHHFRVQSMTFGRPLMLPNDGQVTIPQLIDDEYLTASPEGDDGQQPADVPPSVGFFVYGLKFSEINKNILQYVLK